MRIVITNPEQGSIFGLTFELVELTETQGNINGVYPYSPEMTVTLNHSDFFIIYLENEYRMATNVKDDRNKEWQLDKRPEAYKKDLEAKYKKARNEFRCLRAYIANKKITLPPNE